MASTTKLSHNDEMKNKLTIFSRLNWTNTIFLIVSPIIVWTFVPMEIIFNGLDYRLLGLFLVFCVFTSISITGGYHRLFAHRSYDGSKLFKLFYLIFGAAALQGSALKWCTDHRRHHRFVDTDTDPYSIKKGFFYAHIGWVFLKEEEQYKDKYAHDLQNDPLVAWQHKYYMPIAILVGFVIPTIVGALFGNAWGGLLFGGFARVVLTHHSTFLINSACHFFGSQPYGDKNTARDSFVLALLTYGEGYHNFHHRFQADYRNGIRWYQWDPTKWLIWFGSLVGMTWDLKRVSDFEITKARLAAEEKRLLAKGLPHERIASLKAKVEGAQERFRQLSASYEKSKREWQAQYDEQLKNLKIEMKLAKLEFNAAMAQWRLFIKYA